MTTSADTEDLSDELVPRSQRQREQVHQRQKELLSRIGSSQRASALLLAMSGRDEAARLAEIAAEAVRFEMENPESARRVRTLVASLNRVRDGEDLCKQALEGALSLVGADRGNIQLCDQRTGSLTIAAQVGFDRDFLEHFAVVEDDGSACGRAARDRSQTVITDVNQDTAFAPHREIARSSGFRAVCSTPLIGGHGALVGMLSVHYPRPYRPSDRELQTLKSFGQRLAPMLDRHAGKTTSDTDWHSWGSVVPEGTYWAQAIADVRMRSADLAERMADQAEKLASIFEEMAVRGDSDRRLEFARRERDIASTQRRNAERLRKAGAGPVTLIPLRSLVGPDHELIGRAE